MPAAASRAPTTLRLAPTMRFIDIAFNATSSDYAGVYRDKQRHPRDLPAVLERAKLAGVEYCIFTGGSLTESEEAIKLAKEFGQTATVGLHPTRATEMDADPKTYVAGLSALIAANRAHVVALGELGLDNDRLHFAPAPAQVAAFAAQLPLSKQYGLPLFLHSRAAHPEFLRVLEAHRPLWEAQGGVAHSFTGTMAEMRELVNAGLLVGINGCSLKTSENLAVVRELPLDALVLETDAPFCSCTATHASHAHLASLPADATWAGAGFKANKPEKWVEGEMVKGRLEPNGIGRVAWVVAQVKGVAVEVVAEAAFRNSRRMFWRGEPEQPPLQS